MKALLSLFLFFTLINAQSLKDENLLQSLPKNFTLAYKHYDKKTHTRLLEFIPKGQTVKNWTQMITTTIFHRNINLSAQDFVKRMQNLWSSDCPNSYTKLLPHGKENGYSYALIMLYCPKSKVTHKEEITWLKAIKGNDSFYVVQKAFTYNLKKQEIIETMKYLKNIMICDTRLNNCPKF